jgi:SAM-dependent methyltransferase
MAGFPTRILNPELLESAEPKLAQRNLRDLVRINRWFGGRRAVLRILRDLVRPLERFSVLDVGAASGDMGKCICGRYRNATVASLDHRPFHLLGAPPPQVAADVFHLPFLPGSFDFVLCSLLLHHFPDRRLIHLIGELRSIARRALIVLEIERHPLAYHFLPMTKWLLRWNPLTVHDGRISVAAGFRAGELLSLARASGATHALVRKHWPWFRVSLVAPAGEL